MVLTEKKLTWILKVLKKPMRFNKSHRFFPSEMFYCKNSGSYMIFLAFQNDFFKKKIC